MVGRVNWNALELMSNILHNVLNDMKPVTKKGLLKAISEVKDRYKKSRNISNIEGLPHNYLMEAKKFIISNDFHYDVLNEIDLYYGYNPETDKWDGKNENCRLGKSRISRWGD